jgi:hypothetical protein
VTTSWLSLPFLGRQILVILKDDPVIVLRSLATEHLTLVIRSPDGADLGS